MGAMNSDEPVPRELKVLDTTSLVRLEERACELGLNQRLNPAWVQANAAPDGTQAQEGLVHVIADLPADAQASEPVRVGEGAFHDPVLSAESGAVLGASAGDERLHAEVPDQAAVLVVVVAAVAEHGVGPAPEPAALAANGRQCLKQWNELGDVIAVPAGQGAASGIPLASVIRWCLLPGRSRSLPGLSEWQFA